jgi:hypothetical protein
MGLHPIFWSNNQIRIQGNTEKSELHHNIKNKNFPILMQQWVHNETFQDVSTKIPIIYAASVTHSHFERQKISLNQHNIHPTQCKTVENCFTSSPKWCNTWIPPLPYVFITSFCTDVTFLGETSPLCVTNIIKWSGIAVWTQLMVY